MSAPSQNLPAAGAAVGNFLTNAREQGRTFIQRMPFAVATVTASLSLIFIIECILYIVPGIYLTLTLGLWPSHVIESKEVWRVFSYPLVHKSLLHLLFNLLALSSLLAGFEWKNGTLKALWVLLVPYTVIASAIYLALSLVLPFLADTVVVGASGWFFSILVWRAYQTARFSFFGLFEVSSQMYPILLLGIIGLLIPESSIVGHLCGFLTGHLHGYGALGWCIPRGYVFERIESVGFLHRLVNSSRWVKAEVDGALWLPVNTQDAGGGGPSYGSSNPIIFSADQDDRFPGQGQRPGDH